MQRPAFNEAKPVEKLKEHWFWSLLVLETAVFAK